MIEKVSTGIEQEYIIYDLWIYWKEVDPKLNPVEHPCKRGSIHSRYEIGMQPSTAVYGFKYIFVTLSPMTWDSLTDWSWYVQICIKNISLQLKFVKGYMLPW